MEKQEWMLRRNCSLTPRQLGLAYGVLCCLSFVVAGIFVMMGAWQVIFFTLLELGAVAVAFLVYARHATDREHIALSPDCLLIERFDGTQVQRIRLDPVWARVAAPRGAQDLIRVRACGVEVEIGRHVTMARRRQIARELQQQVPSVAQLRHAA
ncbi:DUF2244 domain-containing protein [Noviherbaspirillum aridicola]|nr:DUF2244 domain-containing protein [Noviherbaspirillum aridicola]